MTEAVKKTKLDSHRQLSKDIIACERCPRLRTYCEAVAREKRKAYINETYWGKPIPNFGDERAKLLIVGLAPAAHGANRTSRMFTGDRSGLWVYRALHRAGFTNQSTYEYANDGLKLLNCMITAVAHCAPPDNKPMPDELAHCSEYLRRTFDLLEPRVVVVFGGIAWKETFRDLKRRGLWSAGQPDFAHGVRIEIDSGLTILGSYHPSQQNTFTKRLTEPMFDSIFSAASEIIKR